MNLLMMLQQHHHISRRSCAQLIWGCTWCYCIQICKSAGHCSNIWLRVFRTAMGNASCSFSVKWYCTIHLFRSCWSSTSSSLNATYKHTHLFNVIFTVEKGYFYWHTVGTHLYLSRLIMGAILGSKERHNKAKKCLDKRVRRIFLEA